MKSGIRIMAVPVLAMDYTNEDSDILRFCVWVETDYDTDGDGMADLVKALVQVPRAAAEGEYKAAVIYDQTIDNASLKVLLPVAEAK